MNLIIVTNDTFSNNIMNRIINKMKALPFSSSHILEAVEDKANLMTYSELARKESLDDVLGKHGAAIILYETKKDYGHWVCIFKVNKNTIEFFDAYGMGPDEQLKYVPKNFRKSVHEDYPHLTEMMEDSGYNIIYNTKRLQKHRKDVSTCGRHVALRLILRDIPMNRYINLFKGQDPDVAAVYLTAFVN